jgi:hypothetical protein
MVQYMLNSVWALAEGGLSDRVYNVISSHKQGTIRRPLVEQEERQKIARELQRTAHMRVVYNKRAFSSVPCDFLIPEKSLAEKADNPLSSLDSLESKLQAERFRTHVGVNLVYKHLPQEMQDILLKDTKKGFTPIFCYCSKDIERAILEAYARIPSVFDPVDEKQLDGIDDDAYLPFLLQSRIKGSVINAQVALGRKAVGIKMDSFVEDMKGIGMPWALANALVKATPKYNVMSRLAAICAISYFVKGPEETREKFSRFDMTAKEPQLRSDLPVARLT